MNSIARTFPSRPITKLAFHFLGPASIAVLFVGLYLSTLKGLVQDWWTVSDYSHGFLIPLLSLIVIWNRRLELQRLQANSSWRGLVFLLLGVLAFLMGRFGQEEFIERMSIPLTLFGLIFYLFGSEGAKLVLFPIGYLYLMIPIPYVFFRQTAIHLRLFDAWIVTNMASFAGIPILREDFLLHLPQISLEVADGCSGALSIIALVAIGIFYIHELNRPGKLILWLLLIPIAVASNILRIFVIVVLTYYSGDWVLQSTFHRLSGTFNFLLGFSSLILTSVLLERLSHKSENRK